MLKYRQDAVNDPPRRTSAGDAFSSLAILILRVNGYLIAAGDVLSRPAGQTSARWQVLAAVEHAPATVAQIARVLGLTRQSVQRVADVLTQELLTAYDENPAHRRAKLLRLLPKGRSALRKIQAAQGPWADKLAEQIGEEALRRATPVLQRLLNLLSDA